MSMIQVPSQMLCGGVTPTKQMMDRMAASGALAGVAGVVGMAGMGDCQSGEEPECYQNTSQDAYDEYGSGYSYNGPGSGSVPGSGSSSTPSTPSTPSTVNVSITQPGKNTSEWATINDLMKMGLSIAGQAYLNNNQAKVAQYGPNGTVLYQTSQIPDQYFNHPPVDNRAGVGLNVGGVGANMSVSSTTLMLLIGGVVLVVALTANRRQ